ncbi:MAG: putative PAS/PAC sensor protein [Stygiobacter sp.]|nr:MAG: putative PAS/PAC sensor protein [Stygiobacter sp.]
MGKKNKVGSNRAGIFINISASTTVTFAVLAISGWITNNLIFASFNSDFIPMALSTAFVFLLLGISLMLYYNRTAFKTLIRILTILNAAGIALSALFFFLAIKGIRLEIEHLWLATTLDENRFVLGHMSPVTAFCLILIGTAVLFIQISSERKKLMAYGFILSALTVLFSFILILLYLFGVPLFYGGTFIPPALTTSLSFLFLGLSSSAVFGSRIWPTQLQSEIFDKQTFFTIALLYLVLSVGLMTAGYSYFKNYEINHRKEVERILLSVTDLKISEIRHWRSERLGDAALFFDNPNFSALVRQLIQNGNDADTKQKIKVWLSRLLSGYSYNLVCLHNSLGKELLKFPDKPSDHSLTFLQSLKKAGESGEINFLDFHRNEFENRPLLRITVPIFDFANKKQVIGYLAMWIDPEQYLYPLIKRWPVPSNSAETLLLRREGDKIVFLNELRFNKDSVLSVHRPLTATKIPAVKAALGEKGIVEGSDYRGVEVIASVGAIPNSPWFIVSRMDRDEVYLPVKQRFLVTLIAVVSLILSSGAGFGYFFRRQKVKYYKERSEGADQIRKLNRLYAVLSNINQAIVRILDKEILFNEVTKIAVTDGKFIMAWVGFFNENRTNIIPQSFNGDGESYLSLQDSLLRKDNSGTCRIIMERENVICNDINKECLELSLHEDIIKLKCRSFVFLPLVVHKQKIGIIALYSDTIHFFDEKEIKLLSGLALDVSFAIEFIDKEKERIDSLEKLSASEKRFRETLENMMEGCQIIGFDWRYKYLNDAAVKYSMQKREELLGERVMDRYPGFEKTEMFKVIDECMRYRNQIFREFDFTYPNGTLGWFEFTIQPVPEGVFILSLDITERKKAEQALILNEARLKKIIDLMPIPIGYVSTDGVIATRNQKFVKVLGYTEEDIPTINEWWGKVYPDPDYRQTAMESWKKAVEHATDVGMNILPEEYNLKCKDGLTRTFEISGIILSDGFLVTLVDVTERKHREVNERLAKEVLEKLNVTKDSTTMINSIIQLIKVSSGIEAVGIRLKDGDDYPYYITTGFSKDFVEAERYLCSYDNNGQVIRDKNGEPKLECMCGNILTGRVDPAKSFFTEGGSFISNNTTKLLATTGDKERLTRTRNRCNSSGYESVALVPIKSGEEVLGLLQLNDHRLNMFDGESIHFYESLGSSIGIALIRNKAQEELNRINEELENRIQERTRLLEISNKELESFAYSVSHDLRAPLRAINGFSKFLEEDYSEVLSDEGKRHLKVIRNNSQKMDRLITDLLSLSKVARVNINLASIDITSMVKNIYEEVIPEELKDAFTFKVSELPNCFGDPTMMKQLWINLISNAIKYTLPREKKEIEISGKIVNDEIVYSIRDSGVGFDPNYKHKLFGIFQRLHGEEEFEGTGVGLAIVKRIAERHLGKVWADAELNVGATFFVSFPIKER